MTGRCSHCGQVLPEFRSGVRLPALKARIFDAVKRAGPDGIAWDDLFEMIYSSRDPGYDPAMDQDAAVRRARLKSHMPQINERLADAGMRIDGRGGHYRLRRFPMNE